MRVDRNRRLIPSTKNWITPDSVHRHAIGGVLMHILRTVDVTRLTGLSRTTLWRMERQGKFPARIRLSLNSVGWRDEEVRHWVETRPRGMTLPDRLYEVISEDDGEREQSERPL